jgi:hypothetical protein
MPAGKIETREGFITDVFRLRPPPQPQTTEAPLPPSVPRPDLAAIELTLPTADPEEDKERTFHRPIFEANGAITYPKAKGEWEPPQIPTGYIRDPSNKWRLLPLWPPCGLRHGLAFIKPNCGCLQIVMRCNNPQAPAYGHRLDHLNCTACLVRAP